MGIYYAVKEDDSSSPAPDVIQWVAVGYNDKLENDNILYTPDGISWQESTGMSFVAGKGVAYGTSNGTSPLWVAVGKDNTGGFGNIMYSADGKEWQKTTTGDSFANKGNGIAYGTTSNGTSPLWIVVGNAGIPEDNIMYSVDGKEWKRITGVCFSIWGNGIAFKAILPNV